jgi:hypothetical protein
MDDRDYIAEEMHDSECYALEFEIDALRAKLDAAREALSILSSSKNYRLRQYGQISLETPREITPPWKYARRALEEMEKP